MCQVNQVHFSIYPSISFFYPSVLLCQASQVHLFHFSFFIYSAKRLKFIFHILLFSSAPLPGVFSLSLSYFSFFIRSIVKSPVIFFFFSPLRSPFFPFTPRLIPLTAHAKLLSSHRFLRTFLTCLFHLSLAPVALPSGINTCFQSHVDSPVSYPLLCAFPWFPHLCKLTVQWGWAKTPAIATERRRIICYLSNFASPQ